MRKIPWETFTSLNATDFNFEATARFRPGFQKLRLLDDPILRRSIFIIAFCSLITIPLYLALPKSYNEIIMVIRDLILLLPCALWAGGGLPRRARLLYIPFASLFAIGIIGIKMGGPDWFVLFSLASLPFAYAIHRSAPHLGRELGFTDKVSIPAEVSATALMSGSSIFLGWYGLSHANKLIFKSPFPGPADFAAVALTGLLHYGALYMLMYGVLFRRLLKMRFQLIIPITLNVALLSMTMLSDALLMQNKLMGLFSILVICLTLQFGYGIAFYFCRSTRMVVASHVIFYLFYKTLVFK